MSILKNICYNMLENIGKKNSKCSVSGKHNLIKIICFVKTLCNNGGKLTVFLFKKVL